MALNENKLSELNAGGNGVVATHCCECAARENETWRRNELLKVAQDVCSWTASSLEQAQETQQLEVRNKALRLINREFDKELFPKL